MNISNQLTNVIKYLEDRIRLCDGDSSEYERELERVKNLYNELEWFKSEY